MRIGWALLMLAGCAGPPPGTNASVEKAAPGQQEPGAEAFRAALDAQEAPFRVPGTLSLRLNEEMQLGEIRLKPLEIVEDSRCPIDATCVWAGRLRLRVAISGLGEPVLQIGERVTLPGGQHLILVGALPPKWARPPAGVDPDEPKRFAFRLTA